MDGRNLVDLVTAIYWCNANEPRQLEISLPPLEEQRQETEIAVNRGRIHTT